MTALTRYEWDDPALAVSYVGALWWVLLLVSVRGSIHYKVLAGRRSDALLNEPGVLEAARPLEVED